MTLPLPQNVNPFIPPIDITHVAPTGAPVIGDFINSIKPDSNIYITMQNTSALTENSFGSDTSFFVYSQSGNVGATTQCYTQSLKSNSAIITIPSTVTDNTLYLLWATNNQGIGTPVILNQPELWWIGPNLVYSGQQCCAFGLNLMMQNNSFVYIQSQSDGTGNFAIVDLINSNPYKITFTIPALPNGNYNVFVHCSQGGAYGWTQEQQISVNDGIDSYALRGFITPTTNYASVVNVKNYGAVGDGSTNDAESIWKAINSCPPNGVIYFPSGNYLIEPNNNIVISNIAGETIYTPYGEGSGYYLANQYQYIQPGSLSGSIYVGTTLVQTFTTDINGNVSLTPVDTSGDYVTQLLFNQSAYFTATWAIPSNWQTEHFILSYNLLGHVNSGSSYYTYGCHLIGDSNDNTTITSNNITFLFSNVMLSVQHITFNYSGSGYPIFMLNNISGQSNILRSYINDCVFFSNSTSNGSIFINGGNNYVINCIFHGSGAIYSNGSTQAFILNNQYYGQWDTAVIYYFTTYNGIQVEGNTAQQTNTSDPNDPSGWAVLRLFYSLSNEITDNCYLGSNTIIDLGARPNTDTDQNGGECMLWDGENISFSWSVVSATTNTITFNGNSDSNYDYTSLSILICSGQGEGQVKRIQSFNTTTNTATLTSPLFTIPDSNSNIGIGFIPTNTVIYENSVSGRADMINTQYDFGTCGISAYMSMYNLYVDNNKYTNVNSGFWITSHITANNNIMSNCKMLCQNNTINNSMNPFLFVDGAPDYTIFTNGNNNLAQYAISIRNNNVNNVIHWSDSETLANHYAGLCWYEGLATGVFNLGKNRKEGIIFENNTITNISNEIGDPTLNPNNPAICGILYATVPNASDWFGPEFWDYTNSNGVDPQDYYAANNIVYPFAPYALIEPNDIQSMIVYKNNFSAINASTAPAINITGDNNNIESLYVGNTYANFSVPHSDSRTSTTILNSNLIQNQLEEILQILIANQGTATQTYTVSCPDNWIILPSSITIDAEQIGTLPVSFNALSPAIATASQITVGTNIAYVISYPNTLPTINISATPNNISLNDSGSNNQTTIIWTSNNATSVSLNGISAPLPLNGSEVFNPISTTTYIAVATNSVGTATNQVDVIVIPPPLPAITCALNPPYVGLGASSIFSWSALNATTLTINGWPKNLSDSETITPQQNTTYNFIAKNVGGTITKSISIIVGPTDGATFISQTCPTTIKAGSINPVSLTFKNSGKSSWDASTYYLGSVGTWTTQIQNTILLNPDGSITYSFNITANQKGNHNFKWRMSNGYSYFGDTSPNVIINVV